MSDLDERLGRYARHLDEHVARFEVPADAAPPRVLDLDARRLGEPTMPTPRHRAWLAAAAALCLILALSLIHI